MSSRSTLALIAVTIPTFAWGGRAAADSSDGGESSSWQRPKTGYVVAHPDVAAQAGGGEISRIIYVNRCVGGCQVIHAESDNARENTSSIPDTPLGTVSTVQEFAGSDDLWNSLVDCVTEVYAPYNVEIVTEDPGDVPHHEAIVAGDPLELGLLPGENGEITGGKALISCGGAINNVISFSFANIYPASRIFELCATVAQESAHSFGLDHEVDCSDPMTYETGCGQKFFRNTSFHCGTQTIEPTDCYCGGSVQNSHQKLLAVFGEGTLPPAPEVSIALPDEAGTVIDGFAVYAIAADKRGVLKLDFYLNGWLWGSIDGHEGATLEDDEPYVFTVPDNLPDGVIDIEVRASNDLSVGSAAVTVTKGEACATAATCLGGQLCDDGRCYWTAPTAELGDGCAIDQDCISQECAQTSAGKLCSQECAQLISDSCPEDFVCEDNDRCAPAVEEAGCCSAGGGLSGGQVALFLLVVAAMLVRRRARG